MANPIIDAITTQDFKDLFYRDFEFVNDWAAGSYDLGDKVFYQTKFYSPLANNTTSEPNLTDWQIIDGSQLIADSDILRAYDESKESINTNLATKMIFLYASAHFLVNDLNNGGVSGGVNNLVNSRSVGSVSESYQLPEWMTSNPTFSFFTTTKYGMKYLILIRQFMVGNFAIAQGSTNA